ncbi:hypothetical protein F5890DRAFT_1547718 [Lentinula detonsa]|uniref:Uncharacterized protein n=1 Tax=Lentinula detonsa TaxID=2804962 RepID=A0AA38PP09_9AGAR|nr:hypothetical protein F5890DRAFT_1547718 [Lentinula detonsa]
MAMTTATATTPSPTLPSEPEPEPHLRESSTIPNRTPISPKPLPDLLSTHFLSLPHIHVACGPCLFIAVKTALRWETMMMGGAMGDEDGPRCPVCRAPIPVWDGKGGCAQCRVR